MSEIRDQVITGEFFAEDGTTFAECSFFDATIHGDCLSFIGCEIVGTITAHGNDLLLKDCCARWYEPGWEINPDYIHWIDDMTAIYKSHDGDICEVIFHDAEQVKKFKVGLQKQK